MANQDKYLIKVNADISEADAKINKLKKNMDKLESTIDRLHNKGMGNNMTTNQKDMDKSMSSMKELANESFNMAMEISQAAEKAQKALKKIHVPRNGTADEKQFWREKKQMLKDYVNQLRALERAQKSSFMSTSLKHSSLTYFNQNPSKNFKPNYKMGSYSHYDMPSDDKAANRKVDMLFQRESIAQERKARAKLDAEKKGKGKSYVPQDSRDPGVRRMEDLVSRTKEVHQLRRRGDHLSRNGAAAGYMSEQQAKTFHRDYLTSQGEYNNWINDNKIAMREKNRERVKVESRISRMQNNPEYNSLDGKQKILAEEEHLAQVKKEIQLIIQFNDALQDTVSFMKEARGRLTDEANPVETKPKRGSFRGMIYERAPAVGLAMGGTVAGMFGGLIGTGQGISRSIRPDLVYAGISSGMSGKGWQNGILGNAMDIGKSNRLGFTAQEMLAFQSSYLNNAGYHGMHDLSSAMINQAQFSRATGIDANTTAGFFGAMANTGGVNGSQMKDLQDAFVGGIKESGMEGRQQQQLQALQSIVTNVSQDKSLTNSQVNSVVALQGLLASSGDRSMQGQSGADFLNQMNNGIKSSFWNPQMRMIFGAGTSFQGGGGMWNLEKQMNAGIVGKSGLKNLQTLTNYSMINGGSNKGMQNYIFSALAQQMGLNLSTDQISQFMNMARNGTLTQANVDSFEKKTKAAGKKQSAKNSKNYSSSQAATQNQSDTVTADQALNLYDSMTKYLTAVNARLGGLNSAAYALTLAFGALAIEMGVSALSFGASSGIRTLTSGTFGRSVGKIEGEEVPGLWGRLKANPRVTKAMADAKDTKLGRAATKIAESPLGKATRSATTKATESSVGQGIAKAFGKIKTTGLGKSVTTLTKLGSKAMLPIAIAGGVIQTATAKKGDRVHQGFSAAGGIAGSIGGAELGASFGSVVPVVGTIIGGLLGGIGGGIVGSGVGGWIGKRAQGLFNGHHKGGNSSSAHSSTASKQQDTHNTTVKAQTENKRTYNIQNESYNLNSQGKQLNQMNNLLATARQQNGIIGTMAAGGIASSGGSSGGGGGKIATGKNAKAIHNFLSGKGMSAGAISGIMGNLMQESGLDPTKPGGGLAQWTGSRQKALQAYAKKTGGSASSLNTQLGFLWKELSSGKYGSASAMNGMSASQAADYFEKHFEKAGIPMMGNRESYANQYMTQFSSNAGVTSKSANKHQVQANINVNVSGNGSTVASELSSNSAMKNVASKLQQMVFGSMGYYSQDTQRVL